MFVFDRNGEIYLGFLHNNQLLVNILLYFEKAPITKQLLDRMTTEIFRLLDYLWYKKNVCDILFLAT